MQKLQTQNIETIKLNKEMIKKFNNQLNNLKHNEETLSIQITEIKDTVKNIYDWRSVSEIKDALNQLILLTINLIEIISEIETSLTFCSLNKLHSSIIDITMLKEIVGNSTKLNFWEILTLTKSHCRIKNNAIDYIIEIPVYTPIGDNLIQITPIPIFTENKMYMLDISEELLIQKKNEFFVAEKCVKIKNNYFCETMYNKAQKCIYNIIKTQNNTLCTYHVIQNPTFLLKVRNSDITIVASNVNKKVKLNCENFERTNIILGVFKVKNSGNCTLNNKTLDNVKHYHKELIFGNINLELKNYQISNRTLELKEIQEQDILVNEIPLINNINEQSGKQIITNIIIITSILILIIIMYRKPLVAFIRHVRFKQALGEINNTQTTDPTIPNLTRPIQLEIPRH